MLIRLLFPPKVVKFDLLMSLLRELGLTELKLLGTLGDWKNLFQFGPALRCAPYHNIAREAEALVAKRLIDLDLAVLVEESEIPTGPGGRLPTGGWLSVDHCKRRQRLIFDRHPQNSTESLLAFWIDLFSGT